MKETFKKVKKEEAIKLIESSESEYVYLSVIDYEKGITESCPKSITVHRGVELIKAAKTIILNGDEIAPHLDLHSILQTDIYNLRREGIVRSLLFLSCKKEE